MHAFSLFVFHICVKHCLCRVCTRVNNVKPMDCGDISVNGPVWVS